MITRTTPSWHTEHWQQQLANGISSLAELCETLNLPLPSHDEQDLQHAAIESFSLKVPRNFVAKMEQGNPQDPLLLQVLPQHQELTPTTGYSVDPLQEAHFAPLPGVIHKYKSRLLLTGSGTCAVNCRYCFRRHFPYADNHITPKAIDDIVEYLNTHPEINEVILSGGDPLATSNRRLAALFDALRHVKTLQRMRIHTRFPVMIPERIDAELLAIIAEHSWQWVMVMHSNHPAELDDNFGRHVAKLKQAGVTLLNQSVLLADINDHPNTLAALSERLFQYQVMPYYLHTLDPVAGAAHFAVDADKTINIYKSLLGLLPGFLVPKLVKETPNATSKTLLDLG